MKRINILLLILLFMFAFTTMGFADKDGKYKKDDNIYYIPPFYEYSESSETTYQQVTWSHVHENYGTTNDNTSYTVSRDKSSSISLCYETTINAVVAETSFGLEVSFGSTESFTTSMSYDCIARAFTLCEYGNQRVKTTGVEDYYYNGILKSSRTVFADWSYSSFSRKKITKYL